MTPLKAIKKYCYECSGENRAQVKGCNALSCYLYPYRMGHGNKREMSDEQRAAAATRLKNALNRNEEDED